MSQTITYDSFVSNMVGPVPKGHRVVGRQYSGPGNRFLSVTFVPLPSYRREVDQRQWWKRITG